MVENELEKNMTNPLHSISTLFSKIASMKGSPREFRFHDIQKLKTHTN